jgi:hypothetical protein
MQRSEHADPKKQISRPVLDKKGGVWDVTFNSSERWSLRRARQFDGT